MNSFPQKAFRLITHADVEIAIKKGVVPLVDVDREDGYIHMSPMEQVLVTAALYFSPGERLYVLEYRSDALGAALKWERVESRDNLVFPHLYHHELRWDAAERLHTVVWSVDGKPAWGDSRQVESTAQV